MTEPVALKRDYYDLLGVPRDVDWRGIDAAYYRCADELKTSLIGEQSAFARAFAELNEAYSVLNDGERRAAYDRSLSAAGVEPPSTVGTALRSRFGWLHRRSS